MRHLAQVFAHRQLKHIKHPAIKVHARKHHIIGRGTPAIKKDFESITSGEGIKRHLKPLKFKF